MPLKRSFTCKWESEYWTWSPVAMPSRKFQQFQIRTLLRGFIKIQTLKSNHRLHFSVFPNIHKCMCTTYEYEWDHPAYFLFYCKGSWADEVWSTNITSSVRTIKGLFSFAEWPGLILQDSLRLLGLCHLRVRKVIKISLFSGLVLCDIVFQSRWC